MATQLVLVTGGSGYIGSYCIVKLLQAGYRVRTTVRSLKRAAEVRAMVKAGGADPAEDALSFAEADLGSDAGWPDAVAGCEYVLHVASPLPSFDDLKEGELVRSAVDGTLRVLRAAKDAGAKRVVLTSSNVACAYGHKPTTDYFTEEVWTNLDGRDVHTYAKSKVLAEKAAWDFVKAQGGSMELTTVLPVAVFGPVLSAKYATSVGIITRLMDGAIPACPRINFCVVDVRDVADLHLLAMTSPKAAGERFLATAVGGAMGMKAVGAVLRARLGPAARRVPTWPMPDFVIWLGSFFSPTMALLYPQLGVVRNASGEKAKRLLGWTPRPREDTLAETAESLLKLGLLKESKTS